MTISVAMVVDILLLVFSLWIVLQVSDRSIFNPSLWYLALHVYSVTFRLIVLNNGGQSASFIGVRSGTELVNAAVASDISLLGVVAATVAVASRGHKRQNSSSVASSLTRLNPHVGRVISILCLIIGTYALLKFGGIANAARARGADISTIDIGSFAESSLPTILATFAVQGALIQCIMWGFTRWRTALLLAIIALTSVNLARTFFILPALIAILIYQTQRRRDSLSFKLIIVLTALGLLGFVFKPIARGIQADDLGAIWGNVQNHLEEASNTGDTQFLDMQATYMAAADEEGKRFYGSTVLPLVYLPIPRFLWSAKPRLNDYATELTSSSRDVLQNGMTPTLSGESYLNFGWIGCAVIPFLYLYGMQMGYRRVCSQRITSPRRLIYLIFLVSMVQTFRDGLAALVLFPLMNYLPLMSWALISTLLSAQRAYTNRISAQGTAPTMKEISA